MPCFDNIKAPILLWSGFLGLPNVGHQGHGFVIWILADDFVELI